MASAGTGKSACDRETGSRTCEHIQALLTNLLQHKTLGMAGRREGDADTRNTHVRYDVTTSDVATPEVIVRVLQEIWVYGELIDGGAVGGDAKPRRSIRLRSMPHMIQVFQAGRGSVEAQTLWLKLVKYPLWSVETPRKERGRGLTVWHQREIVITSCAVYCRQRVRGMKDLEVSSGGQRLQPKPESLWWTSTCAQESETGMNLVAADKDLYFSVCGKLCESGTFIREGRKSNSHPWKSASKEEPMLASTKRISTEALSVSTNARGW